MKKSGEVGAEGIASLTFNDLSVVETSACIQHIYLIICNLV